MAELPVPLTAFIGREQELASVRSLLLDPAVRLLTLTGPPGVGKTRLAIQAVSEAADSFQEAPAFVALAALRDPNLVMPAIARNFGVQESADRSLEEGLRALLVDRSLLLLLDNFEHVLAAGPRLAGLLQACPRLTALVTSRARLRIYGEHNFPVQPLYVPDAGLPASPEEVRRSPAVTLFVACAQSAAPDFALTDDNSPAVARLCRRLDGLPLALELAAPRIALFPPGRLLDHLTRSLSLQAGSQRGVPERLRTLQGAIAWSYDLLSPSEQVLFGRLSVFLGGCALEAAEAVCASPSEPQVDVLEGLASLLDQSLVRRAADTEEARFTMLETLREFALARLKTSGEELAVHRAHAAYFRRFAEEAEPGLKGPDQQRWRDRLEVELDNLRAALAWSVDAAPDPADAECALYTAGALWYFWYWRGLPSEGSPARARALLGAGALAWRQSDYEASRLLLEESVVRWRELGDRRGLAEALHLLGHSYFDQQNYEAARATFEESRSTSRRHSPWRAGPTRAPS